MTSAASARYLIVGPQGSGKGTQGVLVAEAFGVPQVATGDIFRENVKGGTELGKQVQAIIEAGHLVPDELTQLRIERDELAARLSRLQTHLAAEKKGMAQAL